MSDLISRGAAIAAMAPMLRDMISRKRAPWVDIKKLRSALFCPCIV